MTRRIASLWIGNVHSEDGVREILEYSVTEDGDFQGCRFSRELNIVDYEPEYVEWKIFPKTLANLRLMFRQFSYSEFFLEKMAEKISDVSGNCVVAFYGVEFKGQPTTLELNADRFEFMGCYEF